MKIEKALQTLNWPQLTETLYALNKNVVFMETYPPRDEYTQDELMEGKRTVIRIYRLDTELMEMIMKLMELQKRDVKLINEGFDLANRALDESVKLLPKKRLGAPTIAGMKKIEKDMFNSGMYYALYKRVKPSKKRIQECKAYGEALRTVNKKRIQIFERYDDLGSQNTEQKSGLVRVIGLKKSCNCIRCGEIVENPKKPCEQLVCPNCEHQLRPTPWQYKPKPSGKPLPKSCYCIRCGTIVDNPKKQCEYLLCPECQHQMAVTPKQYKPKLLGKTPKSCVCVRCGTIVNNPKTKCEYLLCPDCQHQMKPTPRQYEPQRTGGKGHLPTSTWHIET